MVPKSALLAGSLVVVLGGAAAVLLGSVVYEGRSVSADRAEIYQRTLARAFRAGGATDSAVIEKQTEADMKAIWMVNQLSGPWRKAWRQCMERQDTEVISVRTGFVSEIICGVEIANQVMRAEVVE
jgi:hypothetical protein